VTEHRFSIELFEPRWLGFARWQLNRHSHRTVYSDGGVVEIVQRLEFGWMWRKRGARFLRAFSEEPAFERYYETGLASNQ
jgi:hypothetical protein